jgi:hypothetical protein
MITIPPGHPKNITIQNPSFFFESLLSILSMIILLPTAYIGYRQFISSSPLNARNPWFVYLLIAGSLYLIYNIYTFVSMYNMVKSVNPNFTIWQSISGMFSFSWLLGFNNILNFLLPVLFMTIAIVQLYFTPLVANSWWFLALFILSAYVLLSKLYILIVGFVVLHTLTNQTQITNK